MIDHKTGTREEWLAARLELLDAEKELTRRGDELARRRQELPWVRIEKEYSFETDEGPASLDDLFGGRSQLLIYHFMFGPEYTAGCPSCSAIADGFDGSVVHLEHHDVTFSAVSRAPLEKLQAYKQRMGWTFPWASSFESDFNYDFGVAFTEEQQQAGVVEYGFRAMDTRTEIDDEATLAVYGTDLATYMREAPGMSAFALEDGVVYHTYSAYTRGLDGIWAMYPWLDRAPQGRNERIVEGERGPLSAIWVPPPGELGGSDAGWQSCSRGRLLLLLDGQAAHGAEPADLAPVAGAAVLAAGVVLPRDRTARLMVGSRHSRRRRWFGVATDATDGAMTHQSSSAEPLPVQRAQADRCRAGARDQQGAQNVAAQPLSWSVGTPSSRPPVLLDHRMPPARVHKVLMTEDPETIRRHMELHRERLEGGSRSRAMVGYIEALLIDAISRRIGAPRIAIRSVERSDVRTPEHVGALARRA